MPSENSFQTAFVSASSGHGVRPIPNTRHTFHKQASSILKEEKDGLYAV
ncbi:TPA: hypothetical protein ACM24Q_000289 [Neisseria meningitidis]|nr:hypothetical protein [Neisseria meningitidis]